MEKSDFIASYFQICDIRHETKSVRTINTCGHILRSGILVDDERHSRKRLMLDRQSSSCNHTNWAFELRVTFKIFIERWI